MNDAHEHLEMQWRPVVGEDGRTRMEARWITVGAAADHPADHAA